MPKVNQIVSSEVIFSKTRYFPLAPGTLDFGMGLGGGRSLIPPSARRKAKRDKKTCPEHPQHTPGDVATLYLPLGISPWSTSGLRTSELMVEIVQY